MFIVNEIVSPTAEPSSSSAKHTFRLFPVHVVEVTCGALCHNFAAPECSCTAEHCDLSQSSENDREEARRCFHASDSDVEPPCFVAGVVRSDEL